MAEEWDEAKSDAQLYQNQPYDESLEVPDSEEVASNYTPSPRVPGIGGVRGVSRGSTPPDSRMSNNMNMDDQDDEFGVAAGGAGDSSLHRGSASGPGGQAAEQQQRPERHIFDEEEGDEDDEETEGDDDDDDDDDDDNNEQVEGAYDPAEYEHLAVTPEIKELFQYISRYTPQSIELDYKLKPFIPDYIPAVGDIDAFIKVTRPDNKPEQLGLFVLDEPCAKQSDPTVLDLQLRAISKQTSSKAIVVKSIEGAEKKPKAIDSWIDSISELHRSKPPPTVHYSKNMPDIETLMQEWPAEFEELLKEVGLPTAELDCDLAQYVDIICAMLDIPVHKNRVQSLHVLFTLYSEFKNSQHFKSLADDNQMDNALKIEGAGEGNSDTLIL